MPLFIELEGLDDFERALTEADRALSNGVHTGVARAVDDGAREAREAHRFKNQTGTLEGSIAGYVITSAPGGAEGVIKADAPYASFVDAGTAPHLIYPKAGQDFVGPLPKGQSRRRGAGGGLLTFIGSDGHWVSVHVVHHPGTPVDGFFCRAYLKAERVVLREIEIGVEKARQILERTVKMGKRFEHDSGGKVRTSASERFS
jgi:hypothetical protein